jgi:hypothetical protein
MKRFACWTLALLLFYVLSSGPALLLVQKPAWRLLELDTIYWPLYEAMMTPAYTLLGPYWKLWQDPDLNPLIPG